MSTDQDQGPQALPQLSPAMEFLGRVGTVCVATSTVTLGTLGGLLLLGGIFTPTMGATRAAHLQWQTRQATLARDAAALPPAAPAALDTPHAVPAALPSVP